MECLGSVFEVSYSATCVSKRRRWTFYLRVHETSRSGAALLSAVGAPLVAYGDAEVYLKITFASGGFEYLSAPLRTPIEFALVSELELNILYLVGNQACTSVRYQALFNAHCIFERI